MFTENKSKKAYIALGSNVDTDAFSRFDFLCMAVRELSANQLVQVTNSSKVYETLPVGYLDQTNFLNAVLEIETTLLPDELLDFCKSGIEAKSGRVKTIENGPRTLDVDILLYSDETVKTETLEIPHPRLFERAFVLVPLSDVAPNVVGEIKQYKLVDSPDGVNVTDYDLKKYLQSQSIAEKK